METIDRGSRGDPTPQVKDDAIETGATPVLATLLAVALLGERPTARYLKEKQSVR